VRPIVIGRAILAGLIFLVISCLSSPAFSGRIKDRYQAVSKKVEFADMRITATEHEGMDAQRYSLVLEERGKMIFSQDCAFRVHDPKIIPNLPQSECKSLVAYCFSGGAHCCMALILATRCPQKESICLVDAAHSDQEMKTVDAIGNGTKQIKVQDWQFAYYGPEDSELMLSFGGSPAMQRLLVFDEGAWRPDRPGEYQRYYEHLVKENSGSSRKALRKNRDSERAVAGAMQACYYYLMAARPPAEARELLDSLLPTSWKAEAAKIFEDITSAVKDFDPVEPIPH
jgi:hypothetical protein